MDKRCDARYKKHHRHRKRIEQETNINAEVASWDPLEQREFVGVLGLAPKSSEHNTGGHERKGDRTRADPTSPRFANALTEKHQDQETCKWQCRD
jgi:hypothetical protein